MGSEMCIRDRLDVGRLWGVGPKSRAKLEKIGVRTVPELSAMPEEVLRAQLGEALTAQLSALAHGRDERPIPDREAKSIGHEETFGSDLADAEVLHAELVRMTDIVTSRIRSGVGGAKTWSIKVRLSDFTTLTRSHTWSIPIASTSEVIGVLDRLLVSCLLYTSPSPRDATLSRMPSSA